MEVTLVCEYCKIEFTVPFKQRNKKYCNQQCYINSGIKGKTKQVELYEIRKCINCGNDFEIRKKQPNKLCSDECRKEWNLKPENKETRIKNSIKSNIENNNGVHYFKTEEFKRKSDKSKLEKYGTINHMENQNIKDKFILSIQSLTDDKKKYIVLKRKKTNLEKYNDENYNNREKFLKTINDKFGDFHLKIPEIINKSKETCVKKYGVDNPLKLDENRIKSLESQIKKYGSLYTQTDEYHQNVVENRYKNVKNRVEKYGYTLIEYVDDDYATIKCNKCDNIFTHTQVFRNYEIICRRCYPLQSNNTLNLFIENIFNGLNINFEKNNRKILNKKEIDYLINNLLIGFEINGNYYHSEIHGGKNKKYHINKTELSSNKNIKLFHIFEDEIKNKPSIVESRIKNLLGLTENKIYARKCVIKEVSKKESKIFLNDNHIQGNSVDKFRYGLYYDNELVSIITFGKTRNSLGHKGNNNEYELLRFCNKINTNVVGGFSKLFKYFIKNFEFNKIITYADIRWSGINPVDTVYFKNGFKYINNTPPNYWYVKIDDFLNRLHRFQFRKDVLVKEGFDKNKTEWEIMQEKGYDRVWDCGNMKFEYIK